MRWSKEALPNSMSCENYVGWCTCKPQNKKKRNFSKSRLSQFLECLPERPRSRWSLLSESPLEINQTEHRRKASRSYPSSLKFTNGITNWLLSQIAKHGVSRWRRLHFISYYCKPFSSNGSNSSTAGSMAECFTTKGQIYYNKQGI